MKANRAVYKVHKWLGLVTGLVLVVVGLTGSIVVFYDEIDRWQFRDLTTVAVGEKELPLETRFEAARKARPDAFVHALYFGPDRAPSSADAFYYEKEGTYGSILVDPYTARVLGEIEDGESWADLLLSLHFTLLLRPWGDLIVAVTGFAFLASGMSGLWIYRRSLLGPFRRGVRFSGGLKRASADLHLIVGLAALAFNLVLGVSGAYMMLYAFHPENFTQAREREEQPLPRPDIRLTADELLARARDLLPGLEPHGIYLPLREGQAAEVYGRVPRTPFWLDGGTFGRSRVELNPRTGEALGVVDLRRGDLASQYEAMLYVLHFGQYGGLPVKILYCTGGLTPGLLSITGFVLWWKRRGARAAVSQRLESASRDAPSKRGSRAAASPSSADRTSTASPRKSAEAGGLTALWP